MDRFGSSLRRSVVVAALGLGIAASAPGMSASAQGMSLQEAVRLAVSSHPAVLGAAATAKAAKQQVEMEEAGFYPTLSTTGGFGYGYSDTPSTRGRGATVPGADSALSTFRYDMGLQLSQTVFDGFGATSRANSARSSFKASTSQAASKQEEIALRAVQAYIEILRNREQLDLIEAHMGKQDELKKKAEIAKKQGQMTAQDLEQVNARLVIARNRMVTIKGALQNALVLFVEAVGQMPDALQRPKVPTMVPANPEEALAVSLERHPMIETAEHNIEARTEDVEGAKAPMYPRVSFDVNGSREHNVDGVKGHRNEVTAIMKLNYSLYDGGGSAARRSQASEQLAAARQLREETIRSIEQGLGVAYAALATSRDTLPLLEENVKLSQQMMKGFRDQFDLGKLGVIELMDGRTGLFEARSALANARYTFAFSHYQVLAAMGSLLDSLEISN